MEFLEKIPSTGQLDHFWEWEEDLLGVSTEPLMGWDNRLSWFPVVCRMGKNDLAR